MRFRRNKSKSCLGAQLTRYYCNCYVQQGKDGPLLTWKSKIGNLKCTWTRAGRRVEWISQRRKPEYSLQKASRKPGRNETSDFFRFNFPAITIFSHYQKLRNRYLTTNHIAISTKSLARPPNDESSCELLPAWEQERRFLQLSQPFSTYIGLRLTRKL